MCRLEVRVAAVLAIPRPVSVEVDAFPGRSRLAHDLVAKGIEPLRILVDVIAEEDHAIEVGPLRNPPVGVEVPVAVVGAARDGEAQLFDRAERKRAHAPGRRLHAEREEAVVVGPAGLEAVDIHLERVVGRLVHGNAARDHATCEPGIDRDLDPDVDGAHVEARRDVGPEHDRVGERIAARDAEFERRFGPERSGPVVARQTARLVAARSEVWKKAGHDRRPCRLEPFSSGDSHRFLLGRGRPLPYPGTR